MAWWVYVLIAAGIVVVLNVLLVAVLGRRTVSAGVAGDPEGLSSTSREST